MNQLDLPYLDDIIKGLTAALPAASIYLVGSAARGEAVFRRETTGRVTFFSDYEFFIITRKRASAAVRQAIQHQFEQIEAQINNPNPLFHIDAAYRGIWRLATLPKTIFAYELKQNGVLLHGEDIKYKLAGMQAERLDPRLVNEILIKRLWALACFLPNAVFAGRQATQAQETIGYTLNRNALDLLTVLLPWEGLVLPSFEQRNAALQAFWQKLDFSEALGPGFPAFIQTCYTARRDLAYAAAGPALFADLLGYFEKSLLHLSQQPVLAWDQMAGVFQEQPYTPRQWLSHARLAQGMAKKSGGSAAVDWLRLPKKAILTMGLLQLNQALLAWWLGQEGEAWGLLEASAACCQRVDGAGSWVKMGDFPHTYSALRQRWANFWQQSILLGSLPLGKKEQRILDWRYD